MAGGSKKRWTGRDLTVLGNQIADLKVDPMEREYGRDEAVEFMAEHIKSALRAGVPVAVIVGHLREHGIKVGRDRIGAILGTEDRVTTPSASKGTARTLPPGFRSPAKGPKPAGSSVEGAVGVGSASTTVTGGSAPSSFDPIKTP